MLKVQRALISVSDKTGLADLARGLQRLGVEILSTGGTARFLREAEVPVMDVSDYTGFPEILDGRVKTLHPKIHGGLLAVRDNPEHQDQMRKLDIGPIDMVVVNLYPFERTVAKAGVTMDEAIENIDIGGPSMLRSAAKNYRSVAVVCNPQRYAALLAELDRNHGMLPDSVLLPLAVEVFEHTSRYDRCIHEFLSGRTAAEPERRLPAEMNLRFTKVQDLRYGENPHQAAAFYTAGAQTPGLGRMRQRHGKELSFNNLLDLNASLAVVADFKDPAAVIIKHNNPTGIAQAETLAQAYQQAWRCDPLSAFGGIIGFNQKVDGPTAEAVVKSGFMECVVAPGYTREAFQALTQKKNLRVMEIKLADLGREAWDFKPVAGGLLVQEKDLLPADPAEWTVATSRKPSKSDMEALVFGWTLIKHVRSNAIVLVKGRRTIGIGCGQTSRVESTQQAIRKAGSQVKNALLISDAFLPKTDNVSAAAEAGIKGILQTGGSIADEEVIRAAEAAGIFMVMTGRRHFKH